VALQSHTEPIWSLSWSPDGRYIASGSHDGSVRVWDVGTGNNVFTYHDYEAQIAAVAWSPDERSVASGGDATTVQVWNVN